jgi:hypothetical protein
MGNLICLNRAYSDTFTPYIDFWHDIYMTVLCVTATFSIVKALIVAGDYHLAQRCLFSTTLNHLTARYMCNGERS